MQKMHPASLLILENKNQNHFVKRYSYSNLYKRSKTKTINKFKVTKFSPVDRKNPKYFKIFYTGGPMIKTDIKTNMSTI